MSQKFYSHENNVVRDLYTTNPNKNEKIFQEKMRLKSMRYGFHGFPSNTPMCCEKCVFNSGSHTCGLK